MSITPVQFRTGDIQTGSPTALQNLNTFIRQVQQGAQDLTVPPTWTEVTTLASGWGAYPQFRVQYAQLPDTRVVFEGTLRGGTIGLPAFTLPRALWPGQDQNFAVCSNDAFGKVTIRAVDGAVVPAVGSNVYVSLDGIGFWPGA